MLDLNLLSETILLAVKKQEDFSVLVNELAIVNLSDLLSISNDTQKKAFWINIYNAFYQVLASNNPGVGKSIYNLKDICIAQKQFSLDDIEHGILRRGKHKYGLGYITSFFRSSLHKKLEPSTLDFRIHFALNCGANSCPPIAIYSPTRIDEQLDLSTSSFLEQETTVDKEKQEIMVSRLFLWFRYDFGQKKEVIKILNKCLNVPVKNYKIKYAQYDYRIKMKNFRI
ncbi:MAG: DUF547 domain-containing protein [Crocinitomicaceae bacterium]